MVILGLGSNLGDRLSHLRKALNHLRNTAGIQVKKISPVYMSDALLPENATLDWNKPYFNCALLCETTFAPHELLPVLKNIEKISGRVPEKDWGPRVIDIDILAWDDLVLYDKALHIPHENLHERPFALFPLADLVPDWVYPLPGIFQGKTAAEMIANWDSRFSGDAPLHTKQILHRIDTPELIGILNITPDSFSQDGIDHDVQSSIMRAKQFIANGAEIIDIGAEATHPAATPIDATTEWDRLLPVLSAIKNSHKDFFISPKISIDTRHAETAKKALEFGVDIINDVSGMENPAMQELIKNAGCTVVVMHHLGIPARKNISFPIGTDVVSAVLKFGRERITELEQSGIARDKIIFDIGIGFGKTPEQSIKLLQQIECFHELGVKLLVGHSRKRFFEILSDKKAAERDLETVILSLKLLEKKIHYLRVHEVEMHARAFRMWML